MSVEIPTDKIIDKVFAGFKKITPALIAVFLATSAVLFLHPKILMILGLNNIPELVRTIVGIIFLLSATLIVTIFLVEGWRFVQKKITREVTIRKLRNSVIKLAPEQKKIVLELLENEDKVIQLAMVSGNAIYLQDHGFIHRPDQMIIPGYDDELYAKYVPHSWLIDLYNKEPDLFS